MKKIVIFCAVILFTSIQVSAKVVSRAVEYKDGDTFLHGDDWTGTGGCRFAFF